MVSIRKQWLEIGCTESVQGSNKLLMVLSQFRYIVVVIVYIKNKVENWLGVTNP